MINVELKHDVDTKKGLILAVALGATIGATTIITKESIEYTKNKIKQIKNKKQTK